MRPRRKGAAAAMDRREVLRGAATAGATLGVLGSALPLVGCGSEAHAEEASSVADCENDIPVEPEVVRVPDGDVKLTMAYKLPTERTRGNYSVMQTVLDPKQLIAPHTHTTCDQAVLILDGGPFFFQYDIENGNEEIIEVAKGDFAVKPRNLSHMFWNPTDRPGTYLEFSTRGDFQKFIDLANASDGSPGALTEAAEQANMFTLDDYILETMMKHGLTSVKNYGGITSAVCNLFLCD